MSEQEITGETPTAAPVQLSDAQRIARSCPERRRALEAGASALAGTPGCSTQAESLAELAHYVDELELLRFNSHANDHGEPDLEDDPEDDFADEDEPDLSERVANILRTALALAPHIKPHMDELRAILGVRGLREDAAVACMAFLCANATEDPEVRARWAWQCADALIAAQAKTGGGA